MSSLQQKVLAIENSRVVGEGGNEIDLLLSYVHVLEEELAYIKMGIANEFFWKRQLELGRYLVENRGYTTPCWIWKRRKRKDTLYGYIRVGGRTRYAHAYYYNMRYGQVPEGYELDHKCRTRICVNPEHLEIVTKDINLMRAGEGRRSDIVSDPSETEREKMSTFATYCLALVSGERESGKSPGGAKNTVVSKENLRILIARNKFLEERVAELEMNADRLKPYHGLKVL